MKPKRCQDNGKDKNPFLPPNGVLGKKINHKSGKNKDKPMIKRSKILSVGHFYYPIVVRARSAK